MATVAFLRERIRKINLSMGRAVAAKNIQAEVKWLRYLADATTSLAALLDPPTPAEEAEIAVTEPGSTPSGLTNLGAAKIDAGFVLRASLGADQAELDTNPVPGAAKALGFSGVMASGTYPDTVYGTFVDGVLIETSAVNPGAGPDGFTTPFGLASGINPDALYPAS
jgi:hypothetical protein